MTSIKPTFGPVTTLPHTVGGADSGPASALDGSESLQQAQRTSDARSTGDLNSVSQGHAAASSSATGGTGQLDGAQKVTLVDLARAVESGQLTMGQAVERLVEGTIGSLPRQLTELERSELSQLLRAALENDPTLSGLQDEPA
jgi:hypothetical protein